MRNVNRALATALSSIVLAASALTIAAPAALAGDGPPSTGGHGSVPGSPSTPPGSGGGSTGGGGGGDYSPPDGYIPRYDKWNPAAKQTTGYQPWRMTCKMKSDGRYALGVAWKHSTKIGDNNAEDNTSRDYDATCVYGPSPVLSTVYCPLWLAGDAWGPLDRTNTGPRVKGMPVRKSTPFADGGMRNLAQCGTSWSLAVNAPMTELGRYKGEIKGQVARCTKRTYPNSNQPADIKGCTKQPVVTWVFHGSVWCDGYDTKRWINRDYTMQPCLSAKAGKYFCAPGKVSYAGLGMSQALAAGRPKSAIEVFHDGRNRTATFSALSVSGGKVKNIRSVTTRVNVSGTPLREGVSVNDSTQPVVASIPLSVRGSEAHVIKGDVRKFDLNVQQAGVPGHPLVIEKVASFTADYQRQAIKVTRLDLQTGEMVMQAYTTWVTDTGSCTQWLALDAMRARNVSQ